jgi:CxxC-x17-CxxC domain-containing protein
MGNFNRDRGGNNRFGRSERPSMHRAICATCGRECEVPFKPTGDKPVFCSNCFGKKEDSGRRDKQMFRATCSKCHKPCEVPFRPSGSKPVLCDNCFGKGGEKINDGASQYHNQFEALNAKLDHILRLLEKPVAEVKEKKVVKKKVVAPKKVIAKKKK